MPGRGSSGQANGLSAARISLIILLWHRMTCAQRARRMSGFLTRSASKRWPTSGTASPRAGCTHDTFTHRVDEALRARASGELRVLVADLPRPRRLGAAVRQTCRRLASATDRWLRGWPPVLTLPAGSQHRFTIGRERACDMTLADETVSRWHASLERGAAGGWLLADLGSMNGTRLNGWRVSGPMPVRPGDLVSFGALTFVLTERP